MKKRPVLVPALALLAGLGGCATHAAPPLDTSRIPDELRAAPDAHLDEVLTARGQSVYECRRDGAVRIWWREGELATLVDRHRRSIGTVTPGDHFIAYDDSSVSTRRDAVAQVTAGTLVWSRSVAKDAGKPGARMAAQRRFSRTSVVQRIDTTGGLPPDALCEREGGTLLVPYSATYLFYSPR
ncbi:DUF3455 domain-containing protein [Caballeronia sp. LZ035]|uniref:DUF3455 domain-containing protein n=1 Tax=Caballeronia sp. LZ035 TaxID=3038568 RepID=UPI002857F400|nr:DUF3455 domain-containing protein [Caballeronia sp. LZ035]MDR5759461.1 DUF3455 domain-containing protein [Caballeronia sp. LZ035]